MESALETSVVAANLLTKYSRSESLSQLHSACDDHVAFKTLFTVVLMRNIQNNVSYSARTSYRRELGVSRENRGPEAGSEPENVASGIHASANVKGPSQSSKSKTKVHTLFRTIHILTFCLL